MTQEPACFGTRTEERRRRFLYTLADRLDRAAMDRASDRGAIPGTVRSGVTVFSANDSLVLPDGRVRSSLVIRLSLLDKSKEDRMSLNLGRRFRKTLGRSYPLAALKFP